MRLQKPKRAGITVGPYFIVRDVDQGYTRLRVYAHGKIVHATCWRKSLEDLVRDVRRVMADFNRVAFPGVA